MAQNDIPAQEPFSKKSLRQSGFVKELLDILYTSKNHQTARFTHIADRHSILRAQVHTGHRDYVQRLAGILFVVTFYRLPQLSQRAQPHIVLQLLPTFSTGKNELALPGRRVSLDVFCHSSRLDAEYR